MSKIAEAHIKGISGFLAPSVRRRFLALYEKSLPRAFESVWKSHAFPIDKSVVKVLRPEVDTFGQLRRPGASDMCWFARDGQPFKTGFERLETVLHETWMQHAVLSCIPGKLIYFEGERSDVSVILMAN